MYVCLCMCMHIYINIHRHTLTCELLFPIPISYLGRQSSKEVNNVPIQFKSGR